MDTEDRPGPAQDLYDARTGRRLTAATPAQAQASEDANVGYGGIAPTGICTYLCAYPWADRQPDALAVFTR